ncbi:hypothetical protein DICA3_D24080 [Diutina catenulata]
MLLSTRVPSETGVINFGTTVSASNLGRSQEHGGFFDTSIAKWDDSFSSCLLPRRELCRHLFSGAQPAPRHPSYDFAEDPNFYDRTYMAGQTSTHRDGAAASIATPAVTPP